MSKYVGGGDDESDHLSDCLALAACYSFASRIGPSPASAMPAASLFCVSSFLLCSYFFHFSCDLTLLPPLAHAQATNAGFHIAWEE